MIRLHFVAALFGEAAALISHYRLQPICGQSNFRVYERDHVRLIVSGVGKIKSAQAVSFLQSISQSRDGAWLNVGIGGHRRLAIGSSVLAHKITDSSAIKSWYPQILFKPPCQTASVTTVGQVERTYANDSVYEMEAAGFYEAAIGASTAELVHVFKIISDNQTRKSQFVSKRDVQLLVESKLSEIDAISKLLMQNAKQLEKINQDPPEFQLLLSRHHFTVTERHQLRKLLLQARALGFKNAMEQFKLSSKMKSGEVLNRLRQVVAKKLYNF